MNLNALRTLFLCATALMLQAQLCPATDEPLLPVETPGDAAKLGDRTDAGRMEALAKRGGSRESEAAVVAALKWLVAHQDDDGRWSAVGFTRHCPDGDLCGGVAPQQHGDLPGTYDVATTGLSLLALLGHGSTHQNGEYKEQASRALEWLLKQQDEHTGCFGKGEQVSMYNHAVGALALAEDYAMTRDPRLKIRVIRALGYICQAQQKSGGWDYTAARTDRNDSSVTGWQVMALKSAHACQVSVPWRTTWGILRHFERVTDEEGFVGYTAEPTSRHGIALVAVGILSELSLGMGRDHPTVRRQVSMLLDDLPAWHKLRGEHGHDHSEYYWYYGTLAMYQVGGFDWEKWNAATRDMLVRAQCAEGHKAGSWDPDGYWARGFAGRVYMTALMTLTLEVYYRYLPMYETQDTLHAGAALVNVMQAEENADRKTAILQKLILLKDPTLPELLKKLLEDESAAVRFTAAKSLAQSGDPSGIACLGIGVASTDAFTRFAAIRALEEIDRPEALEPLIRALSDPVEANAARASRALERKTGQGFGFEEAKTPEEKRKIIASWQEWWKNSVAAANLPDVNGSVVAARDGGKRVLLQFGDKDAIVKGMRLKVFRDGKAAGFVEIVEVLRGGMAEATVTRWDTLGGAIRQGDKVATRQP